MSWKERDAAAHYSEHLANGKSILSEPIPPSCGLVSPTPWISLFNTVRLHLDSAAFTSINREKQPNNVACGCWW